MMRLHAVSVTRPEGQTSEIDLQEYATAPKLQRARATSELTTATPALHGGLTSAPSSRLHRSAHQQPASATFHCSDNVLFAPLGLTLKREARGGD